MSVLKGWQGVSCEKDKPNRQMEIEIEGTLMSIGSKKSVKNRKSWNQGIYQNQQKQKQCTTNIKYIHQPNQFQIQIHV